MNEIEKSIIEAVEQLINNSTSKSKISSIMKKHDVKLHFVPYNYRILGGILQSMNIQFGNFLEVAIKNIVELNPNNEILNKFSGRKSNKFSITLQSENEIDGYILECQTNSVDEKELSIRLNKLLDRIIHFENTEIPIIEVKHDIDLLFKDKKSNCIYYAEIKYNDDHDTGKFMDINRKFLKTYAYLIRELKITKKEQLKPILMYFNKKRMKGNIYLPENENIYRGNKFFDTFTTVNYEYLDTCFKNISESKAVIANFNQLYKDIMEIG